MAIKKVKSCHCDHAQWIEGIYGTWK